jgi:dienelactone hydrolase
VTRGRARAALAAVIVAGLGAAGCSGGSPASTRAVITVDAATALADQPVHLRITGLAPGDEITVQAEATDYRGEPWQAQAVLRADTGGVVALDTTAPVSGSYQGVDGMGLFWSMGPRSGDADYASFSPPFPELQASFEVHLSVTAHGRLLATRNLIREWLAAGVTAKTLSLTTDTVVGELFIPPGAAAKHPAVLVFGGSEGGVGEKFTAALFASHGYPALALGYFNLPGLPASLQNIPLEYFADAARLLAAQAASGPTSVVAVGYSRGSEAALLLGEDYPQLFRGVVVYSPSAQVNPGFPNGGNAWTKDGQPVAPGAIPLDHISGPVLAIAGADDQLWRSADWARQIDQELDAAHDTYAHQAVVYPNAGHGAGAYPFFAQSTKVIHPLTGKALDLGGTRAGNAAAQEDSWPRALALLASVGH